MSDFTKCRECSHFKAVKPNGLEFCTKYAHKAEDPETDGCTWGEPKPIDKRKFREAGHGK